MLNKGVLNINAWMKIKIGNNPEIDTRDITSRLFFLDDDENPVINNTYNEIAGFDGSLFNSAFYARNSIDARFLLKFQDWTDYKLAKHDIFKTFLQKSLIRIRTSTEPAIVKYVRTGSFEIAPLDGNRYECLFTIPFENPSGYKYSLLTSDNLYTYETEGWQIGMNLPNGQDLQYNFVNQSQFRVYNASDITVDPYMQRHELKIIIKHSGGAFGIENKTTGDLYRFNGNMDSNDTLMIDGINTYKNNALADNQTNYSYLTLAAGWNDIRIIGATDLDITFSFPFIYLG